MGNISAPEFSQLVDLRTEIDTELMESSIRLKRLGLPRGWLIGTPKPDPSPASQRRRKELAMRTAILAQRKSALDIQIQKQVHPDVHL